MSHEPREVLAGELHSRIFNAARDTVHGFDVLPIFMRSMIECDGWRRFARPVDGKVFTHEKIESWVLGESWAGGLDLPSWEALYAMLDHAKDAKEGKAVRELLVSRGAPANGLAADVRKARDGPGRPTDSNMGNSHISGGKDTASTIARLKRDRPDLAGQVIAGELSANAAAIQAGFRVRTITIPVDAPRAAKAILRHFDQDR